MSDADLIDLAEKFIKQRVILAAASTPSYPMPHFSLLGPVKGVSYRTADGCRVMDFEYLQFEGNRHVQKSIVFREGKVIDFTYAKSKNFSSQFGEENNKFWLLKRIQFKFG